LVIRAQVFNITNHKGSDTNPRTKTTTAVTNIASNVLYESGPVQTKDNSIKQELVQALPREHPIFHTHDIWFLNDSQTWFSSFYLDRLAPRVLPHGWWISPLAVSVFILTGEGTELHRISCYGTKRFFLSFPRWYLFTSRINLSLLQRMPIRLLVSNNQSPVMVIEIARPSSPIMSKDSMTDNLCYRSGMELVSRHFLDIRLCLIGILSLKNSSPSLLYGSMFSNKIPIRQHCWSVKTCFCKSMTNLNRGVLNQTVFFSSHGTSQRKSYVYLVSHSCLERLEKSVMLGSLHCRKLQR